MPVKAVPGEPCRTTSRPGRRCTTTSSSGNADGTCAKTPSMSFARWPAPRPGDSPTPSAAADRQPIGQGPRWAVSNGVSTAARRYKGGNAISLWIPWVFLIAVVVTAANVDDARAAQDVFAQVRGRRCFLRLQVVFADARYHNHALYEWLSRHWRLYRLEIVAEPSERRDGFKTVVCALGRRADLFLARALPMLDQRLRAYTAGE